MEDSSNIEGYIAGESLSFIRQEIEAAGGSEVLFAGFSDPGGKVTGVRVLARGNDIAAPAVIHSVRCGDVLIHNHPSGVLKPSIEDINIASVTGAKGAGFYIINNSADRIYAVVPPHIEEKIKELSEEEVLSLIGPASDIAKRLKGYEERPEQAEMAVSVTAALNGGKLALIEAGTGVGKSMAYLVPAILWSLRNGERIVVSTNTINLQEQLIHKDIPFLHSALGMDFKAVLVKGRGNYACRRKASGLASEEDYLFDSGDEGEEKSLLEWVSRSRDGSRSDLGFVPKAAAWEKVASEADLCMRASCGFYNECFFYRARREAASSNILVANHHLLFADIAVRGETGDYKDSAVMPPYQRVIIDEAHNIEGIATDYFGSGVSRSGLMLLLGRFVGARDRRKGLFPFIHKKLYYRKGHLPGGFMPAAVKTLESGLLPGLENIRAMAGELFDFMGYLMAGDATGNNVDSGGEGRRLKADGSITKSEGWKEVTSKAVLILQDGRLFLNELGKLSVSFDDLPEREKEQFATQLMELKAYGERLAGFLSAIEAFFCLDLENVVKWIEISPREGSLAVRLNVSPLSVAEAMNEKVFDAFKTVALTSATLSVDGSFDFMSSRIGLSLAGDRVITALLASPFDFKKQAFIGIPADIPSPSERDFSKRLEETVFPALKVSDGRAFVLFTSYRLMDALHAAAERSKLLKNYTVMKQGEAPRHDLLERFRRDKTSVIFGSDSFWEGVDVPGEALMNVILTKLPFSVPDDPVIEARTAMIREKGGNPFMDYILPMAVLRFRQGFGRLIRSKTDRGAVLITDSRVIRKSYGAKFIKSLPECRIVKGPAGEVLKEMEKFFKGG